MAYKIPILIAARLKSRRLRKKAILKLFDEPLIIKLIQRLKKSKFTNKIVVCTSTHEEDLELCRLLEKNSIAFYQGDEMDVMSRFIDVAKDLNAKTIVRVTADNPLTDPEIMDEMIESHFDLNSEYTFADRIPDGAESEIIQTDLLLKCHKMLVDKTVTEYMSWILNRPDHFKVNKYKIKNKHLRRSDVVITVDTKKDFELVSKIYKFFNGDPSKLCKIIEYYDTLPSKLKRNENGPLSSVNKDLINIKFLGED